MTQPVKTDTTNPYVTETVTVPSRLLLRLYVALDCFDRDSDDNDALLLAQARDALLAQAPYATSALIQWEQTVA